MSCTRGLCLAAILGLFCGVSSRAAETTHPLLTQYQDLQAWAFASVPLDVPADGLRWRTDVAEWHLESGRIWLQRPTADGQVTGLVFEGSGSFEMAVPDPVELRQLRRFIGEEQAENLVGSFDAMVLRGVSLGPVARLPQPSPQAKFKPISLASQRHRHWLALRRNDVDARVLAALGSTEDSYLRVDMKTREHGWLTFDYDAHRAEEIVVEWFNPAFSVLEGWLSLDREADRLESGRPTAEPRPSIDIQHVAITADLQKFATESQRGAAKIRPMDAKIEAEIVFEPLRDGDRIVQLFLHPWAKVEAVRDEDSNELGWIRDHLGKRSSAIQKKVHDDSLIVLLERPLTRGQPTTLHLAYELELSGFAPGRNWYPSASYPGTGLYDLHTAALTVHQRPNSAAKSLGSPTSDATAEGVRTTEWQFAEPLKMLSFVFARQHHEETFDTASGTTVEAFSSLGGFITGGRVRELGEDTLRILEFYEELLGSPADAPHLVVGLVPATHGQAFQGLIHIGDYSTLTDRVAERELFRAHEVAHLWWGHQVGWRGYRDQWLSEGFSQYSAMMFVEAVVDDGEKYLEQMLTAFTNELIGSIQSGFNQFSQPNVSLLNKRAADRVGPVGHGLRCRVGEAPTAYRSQNYKRGALALHSLRMILRARTGSDDSFIEILRTFVDTYKGGHPATEDFQEVVETITKQDWSWFFDTWIYRAEIPTYAWSHNVSTSPSGDLLDLEIEQRNVTAGSAMEIPVKIEFANGDEQILLAFLDQPRKSFQFSLTATPERVVFNPDHAVLARVKKK